MSLASPVWVCPRPTSLKKVHRSVRIKGPGPCRESCWFNDPLRTATDEAASITCVVSVRLERWLVFSQSDLPSKVACPDPGRRPRLADHCLESSGGILSGGRTPKCKLNILEPGKEGIPAR